MTRLHTVVSIELIKAWRSRLPVVTAGAFLIAPAAAGLFMLVAMYPELGERTGLLTAKADVMTETADWPEFLGILTQAAAIGGFVVFGIAAIWLFGREFSERTHLDLLALPVSRAVIVGAKFVVLLIWAASLTVVMIAGGLAVGFAVDLPGGTSDALRTAIVDILHVAALALLLATPFSWIASARGGYFEAMASLVLVLVLAMILAATGWGRFFPWSIPGLASGAAGPDIDDVAWVQYALVGMVGAGGVLGTMLWWRWADHR